MRRVAFLFLSFLSNVGDAIFLTGVPLYLFLQSGALTSTTYVPIVISLSILIFRKPLLSVSEMDPLLLTGAGELAMVAIELVLLALLPWVPAALLLSLGTIPLALTYNAYGAAKFFRIQENFFTKDLVFWTSLQGVLNKVGFIVGGSAAAWLLDQAGVRGLLLADAASFLLYGAFMLINFLGCGRRDAGITLGSTATADFVSPPVFARGALGLAIVSSIIFLVTWERAGFIPTTTLASGSAPELVSQVRLTMVLLSLSVCAILLRFNHRWLFPIHFGGWAAVLGGALLLITGPAAIHVGIVVIATGLGILFATQLPVQKSIYGAAFAGAGAGKRTSQHWLGTAAITPLLLPIGYISERLGTGSLWSSVLLVVATGFGGGWLVGAFVRREQAS